MQGVVLVLVIMVILVNLLVDIVKRAARSEGGAGMHRPPSPNASLALPPPAAALWRWMRSRLRARAEHQLSAMLLIVAILARRCSRPIRRSTQDVSKLLLPPSVEHWLGTDDLGRDVLSRLIWGAPNSLYASLLAVSVAIVAGRADRADHRVHRRLARRGRQPVHRRAAVVSADRAGDCRHRRARHRPDQRDAVGRHRVRAVPRAARASADAGGEETRSMSMRRAASAPRHSTSSRATSCRMRSSR